MGENECPHESLHLDWSIDQESMCLYVYGVECQVCGAKTEASSDPEIVLGPWRAQKNSSAHEDTP